MNKACSSNSSSEEHVFVVTIIKDSINKHKMCQNSVGADFLLKCGKIRRLLFTKQQKFDKINTNYTLGELKC